MASPNREGRGFWGWPESTQSWGLGLSSLWVVLYASTGSVLIQGWVFEEERDRCLVPSRCSLKHTVCLLWAVAGSVLHLNTHGTIFIVTRIHAL